MNKLTWCVFLFAVIGCELPRYEGSTQIGRWVLRDCLEGHAYWRTGGPGSYYYSFTPILTDTGKPVKCKEPQ